MMGETPLSLAWHDTRTRTEAGPRTGEQQDDQRGDGKWDGDFQRGGRYDDAGDEDGGA